MQVNQDFTAVRQYAQPSQVKANAAVPSVSTDKVTDKATEAYAKPDTDRLELSDKGKDITKMSDSERSALVQSLKDSLDSQMGNFTNMMMKTFQKQGITAASLQGDNFWKFMASGNYTVDAKTKADAQAAISEDGFWGVKQTSQRIFDFAAAVAGDDPETMKKMQAAVEKGFKEAGVAWGGDLPSICGDTHAAVNKLFDDYYASH
ncbi:MAG: hypothetical protein HFG61_09130 [Lachnospiraceae bacterium]|nr:hypothetical protein [Lachnospiraceae bacterium]